MTRISGKTLTTVKSAPSVDRAVKAPAREAKATASEPKLVAAGVSPLRVALQTALASRGLTPTTAKKNLQGGLESARVRQTSPVIEESARQALAALGKGGVASGAMLVAEALHAAGGPEGIAILIEALERRGAKVEGAERLLDDVRAAAVAHLGALAPGGDHRAALAAIIASDAALGATRVQGSSYLSADYFNNEPGLKELLAKEPRRGGAAIGVGGALLDVAVAHGSDLIVSVDVSPAIRPFLQTVAAVLLVVDEECAARGLTDSQRLDLVQAHLGFDAGSARPLDETLAKLGALGLDNDAGARDVLSHLRAGRFGIGGNSPANASWLTVDGVKHLTGLAQRGRIVAVTMDLASPELPSRLNALLQAHGTRLGAVHLSNALDYISALDEVRGNLAAIDKQAGARLTTSAIEMWEPIAAELGDQRAPRAHDLVDTLKDGGLLARVVDARWGSSATAMGFWERATSERFGRSVSTDAAPRSHAEMAQRIDALEASTFGTPASAKKAFAELLASKRLLDPLLESIEGKRRVDTASGEERLALAMARIDLPAPRNGRECQALIEPFTTSFWTAERKQALLRERFIADGLPPSLMSPLLAKLEGCRDDRDIMRLLWSEEMLALKKSAQRNGVQLVESFAVEVFGLPRKDADARAVLRDKGGFEGYRESFFIESARDLCTHAGHLLSFASEADRRESLVRMLSLALKRADKQYLLYTCVEPPGGSWKNRDLDEVVDVARATRSFPAPASREDATELIPQLIASLERGG